MENKIQFCFYGCCYLATIALFIFGIHKFVKNDDLCETSFKLFNEDSYSSYPSFTLCLSNPFKKELFKELGINESMYLSYLVGNEFTDEMFKVDFNEATFSLT